MALGLAAYLGGESTSSLDSATARGSSHFQKRTYFVLTIATSEQPGVKRTWLRRSEGSSCRRSLHPTPEGACSSQYTSYHAHKCSSKTKIIYYLAVFPKMTIKNNDLKLRRLIPKILLQAWQRTRTSQEKLEHTVWVKNKLAVFNTYSLLKMASVVPC